MNTKVYYEWFTVDNEGATRVASMTITPLKKFGAFSAVLEVKGEATETSRNVEDEGGLDAIWKVVSRKWPHILPFSGGCVRDILDGITAQLQKEQGMKVYHLEARV